MPTRPSSTGRSATALLVLVTLLPVALALVVYMVSLRDVRLGGDEPHYLIMADSLTTDRSFELRQAYERDAATRAIFGPVPPHMLQVGERWMPYHTLGLSMVIAAPSAWPGLVLCDLRVLCVGS
jgi:hypothetical protein